MTAIACAMLAKVVRVWYNYSVEAICLISHEPDGLQASAGRGFSPPTCIILYCTCNCWLVPGLVYGLARSIDLALMHHDDTSGISRQAGNAAKLGNVGSVSAAERQGFQ
jgi:hypothetical protein